MPCGTRDDRLLERTTADGHRIRFGLAGAALAATARAWIGWFTLAALLLLTGAGLPGVCAPPAAPAGRHRRRRQRFGAGDFASPFPCAAPARRAGRAGRHINTMATDIHQMLEAKRGLLLAISHELRSPLTRARLNAELLPEDADTGAQAQRAAARPGPDARPDHRPAGKRAPGQPATPRCTASRWTWPRWRARWLLARPPGAGRGICWIGN
jgi:signal transduction histidine kinase